MFVTFQYAEWICNKYGEEDDDDGTIDYKGMTYDSMDECIKAVEAWHILGFIFYFFISVPSMLVSLQIFYYYMKSYDKEFGTSNKDNNLGQVNSSLDLDN